MNERDLIHINRIKSELLFLEKALCGIERKLFLSDDVLQHAICMALITIGECANHLSGEFKEKYADIEWIQIVAVRNIAAHGYWQLNMEQIWQAMIEDVPKLIKIFEKL